MVEVTGRPHGDCRQEEWPAASPVLRDSQGCSLEDHKAAAGIEGGAQMRDEVTRASRPTSSAELCPIVGRLLRSGREQ